MSDIRFFPTREDRSPTVDGDVPDPLRPRVGRFTDVKYIVLGYQKDNPGIEIIFC